MFEAISFSNFELESVGNRDAATTNTKEQHVQHGVVHSICAEYGIGGHSGLRGSPNPNPRYNRQRRSYVEVVNSGIRAGTKATSSLARARPSVMFSLG